MNKDQVSRLDGFTLIELILSIIIIGMFSGASIATYHTFNEQKKLETDTKKFESILELARKKAIVGEYSQCSGSLQSYSIAFDASVDSPTAYSFNENCSSPTTLETYDLSPNDVFSSVSSSEIFFPLLKGGITGSAVTIIIKNTSLNKCYQLIIDPSGVINETGPTAC
jgi:prepilin-type N-terminal cleavage/methylation domain-containing protein